MKICSESLADRDSVMKYDFINRKIVACGRINMSKLKSKLFGTANNLTTLIYNNRLSVRVRFMYLCIFDLILFFFFFEILGIQPIKAVSAEIEISFTPWRIHI